MKIKGRHNKITCTNLKWNGGHVHYEIIQCIIQIRREDLNANDCYHSTFIPYILAHKPNFIMLRRLLIIIFPPNGLWCFMCLLVKLLLDNTTQHFMLINYLFSYKILLYLNLDQSGTWERDGAGMDGGIFGQWL